jgi:Flp pilus assembly pilin Flp
MKTLQTLKNFWLEEEGGESVEWPLVVALIIIGIIATWALLQTEIVNILNAIIAELQNALA